MIAASAAMKPGGSDLEPRIRGQSVDFWQKRMIPGLRFFLLSDLPADTRFLILFHPSLLVFPTTPQWRQLTDELYRHADEEENIFTVPGREVLILSRHFIDARPDRIDFSLFQDSGTTVLPFPDGLRSSSWRDDPAGTERLIVTWQIAQLQEKRVRIHDFNHFYLDGDCEVGMDTELGSGVVITANSSIGAGSIIHPHSVIDRSRIGDHCEVLPGTVIRDSILEDQVIVGPYAHLRNQTVIKKGAKIGNFVEFKKSLFGEGSKAMHLSYIGDATVGREVNIGAGTITCNYDGRTKHPTTIEDHVFIGSGTELVAPVTIERNAYVGAGSTITQDVPANSLAVARERQRNILDWVLRKKKG